MTDDKISLPIKRLDPTVELPSYAYAGDAGLDLRANEDVTLAPHERRLVSTGLAVAIPEGYAGFVQPRSGLALREGLSMANTPGLVDSTDGSTLASGGALQPNHLYLITADGRGLKATADATVMVRGSYTIS